jgi:DNA-binding beta-propeller fold protein YncE
MSRMNAYVGMTVLLLTAGGTVSLFGASGPYHFLREIPIGTEGGWDYLSVDSPGHRLYVSHGASVVVIDLDSLSVKGEITNTPGVHGLAVAPELGRGFSSNGRESKSSIVDLKTLATLSKVDTGEKPDAILYVPGHKEVYTFNGRGNSATVFGAESGKVVATIPLPGKPEFAAYDPGVDRVYNNIEDKNEVVALDATAHKVADSWPIAPGEEASGLAVDPAHHHVFIGCHNNLMLMLDGRTGKVLSQVAIGDGVDANAFDPGTEFAFASCGDGTVTIARAEGDKLALVQSLKTTRGARTMTLDPRTHNLYLAAAQYEAAPADAGTGGGRKRPKMVAGSFKVLVYAMDADSAK